METKNIKWLIDNKGQVTEVYHVVHPFNFEEYMTWLDGKIDETINWVNVQYLRQECYIQIYMQAPKVIEDISKYMICDVKPVRDIRTYMLIVEKLKLL